MKNKLAKNTTTIASGDVTTIETKVSDINALLLAAYIEMLKSQKKMYPLAGPKKDGTITLALQKAKDHPEILPQNYSIADFQTFVTNRAIFGHLRNLFGDLYKKADDSYVAYGILASNETDNILGYFKMALPDNPSLEAEFEQMDEFFVRGKRKVPVAFNVPANGGIDVNKCVPGTMVTNSGNARLSLSAGSELSGRVKRVDPLFIDPNSSVKIPVGYTSIHISNLSATEVGSFNVKVRV